MALMILVGAIAVLMNAGHRIPPRRASSSSQFEERVVPEAMSRERLVVTDREPVEDEGVQPTGVRAAATQAKKFGAIVGSVFDFRGNPLANQGLAFYGPGDLSRARRVRAQSDQGGYYAIERMPVGLWSAYTLGAGETQQAALIYSGEVEISEGRTSTWNFVLPGDRRLSGAFTLGSAELDRLGVTEGRGISLQLELRSRWQAELIVARGSAQTLRKSKDTPQADPAKADVPEQPRGVGHFEMSGLLPDQYVLRIRIPGSAKDASGELIDLYIERDVDLSQGDVALPSEEFTLAEFVEASLKRE